MHTRTLTHLVERDIVAAAGTAGIAVGVASAAASRAADAAAPAAATGAAATRAAAGCAALALLQLSQLLLLTEAAPVATVDPGASESE